MEETTKVYLSPIIKEICLNNIIVAYNCMVQHTELYYQFHSKTSLLSLFLRIRTGFARLK